MKLKLTLLLACVPCGLVLAGDFDGSKPLLCAPTEAAELPVRGDVNIRARPADLGIPAFFRIDIPRSSIVGPKHTAPIRLIEQGKQQLVLQGTELGMAWTLVLDREDGTIVGTYADRFGVVALSGACTPAV